MSKTFLCITIDTECDRSPNWTTAHQLSFTSVLRAVPELLQPLFVEAGALPTYLLTYEVMENAGCREVFRALEGHCELGTHLHADNVEPQSRISNLAGQYSDDFQIDYPPEVELAKLASLTEAFQTAFGRAPKVFRAGRFAANGNTIRALASLGYLVDSSVTPNLEWENREGKKLSFVGAPLQPYFVSPDDILKKAPDGVLEVPVTILPKLALRASVKRMRPVYRPAWLRPVYSSADDMKKIVDRILSEPDRGMPRVLNMMFHSMELVPNASPYTKSDGEVRNYLSSIREVLAYCRKRGVEFVGLQDIYDLYAKCGTPDRK
jgi:hypothetical protein